MHSIKLVSLVAVALMIIAGCQSTTIDEHEAGTWLPDEHYIVGGGFEIDYTAPDHGTIILANQTTGQLLVTQSVEAGERYGIEIDPTEDGIEQMLGGDPSEVRIMLYFIPGDDHDEDYETME